MSERGQTSEHDLIAGWLSQQGTEALSWTTNEEGEGANLGRFRVIEDVHEEEGPFEGDEGNVRISVVGSDEYGTRRVHVGLKCDGMEEIECPFEVLEEVSE